MINSNFKFKGIHHINGFFIIFISLSIMVFGPVSLSNIVYAQSNESQSEPDSKNVPTFENDETTGNSGLGTSDSNSLPSNLKDDDGNNDPGVSNVPGQSADLSSLSPGNECLIESSLSECNNGGYRKCPTGFVTRGENAECMPEPQESLIVDNDTESDGSIEPLSSDTQSDSSTTKPDRDCLFDPDLPKCAAVNGKCPDGFNQNEDEQCVPRGGCPKEYHTVDDDETGRCIPNSDGCPTDMIFRPGMKTCGYKEDVCKTYPNLEDCKVDDNDNGGSNTPAFNSGYSHGCSDAKISDSSKRYINQPGKGPGYHTNEFMRGYNDGFESCSGENNPLPPSTSQGTFKVIVEVESQSPRDISGGITVSVDHQPENIFNAAYGIYFPAGETVSKTFTFKSSDVPIGTEFEVNIDYGDDYNQRQFGENSPEKRPEVIQFNIP